MTSRLRLATATVVYVAAWIACAVALPERVPMHFTASGRPDRWADRADALVAFAVLGVVIAALFWVLDAVTDRLPSSWINTPHRDWWLATPEREARLRALSRAESAVIGAATLVVLAAALLLILAAARSEDPRLGWPALVVFALYLGFVGVYVVRARVRHRPAEDDAGADTRIEA